jgi:hypothetical protein
MKILVFFVPVVIAFGCGSRLDKTSVFLYENLTQAELRENGFAPVRIQVSNIYQHPYNDNWLKRDLNDTGVLYLFADSMPWEQYVSFDNSKVDSNAIFNFLHQLGFKRGGDSVRNGDIIFYIHHSEKEYYFTRWFTKPYRH